MKTISSLLLASLFVLAMDLSQEAQAGSGCGPTGCPVPASLQRAPATASTSRAFTATGGSRVADVNLSPEAREVINAEGKEPPLPKGFLSAADRAKLIAKQTPLYGWPQDEFPRPSFRTQPRSSTATRVAGNSRSSVPRSPATPVKQVTTVKVATAAKARSQN